MAENTPQGTALPVRTTSDLFPVYVIGMGGSPRPRGKATPDGEETHASGAILLMLRKDGTISPDKSASVHVVEPAATYELGKKYRAQGAVWVQPYTSGSGDNARMALSITVQRLVPADAPAAPTQPQNGGERRA